jgi:hypothetical protein
VEPPTGLSTNAAPFLCRRAHGAHLDKELAFDLAGEESVVAAVSRFDRGSIGDDADHDLARGGELARCRRDFRAGVGERLRFLQRAVPHGNFVSNAHQPLRHRCAHPAHSRDTDFQVRSPKRVRDSIENTAAQFEPALPPAVRALQPHA